MTAETAIALIVFLFPLAYSPGPGNMFFAANGARFGLASTIPASAGYHVATVIVTALIGLGFARAADLSPALFTVVKFAGSAYVLWLALKLMRAGRLDHAAEARPAGFVDGAVLLLLNPKAYVIIAAMFTQFIPAGATGAVTLVLAISVLFTFNNLVAFTAWTALGDRISARFRDAGEARRLNVVFGAMLALVAVWMLLS